MTTYKNLSKTLGLTAAASLTLTALFLALTNATAPQWQVALIVGLPLVMLLCVWRFLAASERKHSLDDQNESERKQAVGAIYAIGLAILVAQGLAIAKITGVVADQPSGQVFGIAVGILVVILGNAMPKVAFSEKTLESRKLSAHAAQAANRFSGFMMMIAGVGMVLAWLVLPYEPARWVAPALLVAALIASFVRFQRARRA